MFTDDIYLSIRLSCACPCLSCQANDWGTFGLRLVQVQDSGEALDPNVYEPQVQELEVVRNSLSPRVWRILRSNDRAIFGVRAVQVQDSGEDLDLII